jgi:hypothetical protein
VRACGSLFHAGSKVKVMSELDDGLDDELSDEAIDAEYARRTREMQAQTAPIDAGAGPVSLGIEGLSTAELDELILARAGEIEPTNAKVKSVMAANDAATPAEDEEVPVAPGSISGLSDADFSELVRKRQGAGSGW